MRMGANLQKLSNLVADMKASDPEGHERIEELHYETFVNPDGPGGVDVRITFVKMKDMPGMHPVDMGAGPWHAPVPA